MLVCINPVFVILEQSKAARFVSVPLLPTVAYCGFRRHVFRNVRQKDQKFGQTRNRESRLYSHCQLLKVIFEVHKFIMLPVGGVMAFISWFCFSLGVNGS